MTWLPLDKCKRWGKNPSLSIYNSPKWTSKHLRVGVFRVRYCLQQSIRGMGFRLNCFICYCQCSTPIIFWSKRARFLLSKSGAWHLAGGVKLSDVWRFAFFLFLWFLAASLPSTEDPVLPSEKCTLNIGQKGRRLKWVAVIKITFSKRLASRTLFATESNFGRLS